jgi:hypothetical protein
VVAVHGGSGVMVAEEAKERERERELTAKRRKKLGGD